MGAIAERIPLHLDGLSAEQLEVFTAADWADWKERRRQYWIEHPPKKIGLAQRWASELAEQDLAVISSDAIEMRRVNDFPFRLSRVAVYRYDPETSRQYHYGSIVNSGYLLRTISTRKTRIVRCHHLELEDTHDGPVFFSCPECHRFPDPNSWISRRAIQIIRPDIDPEEPWKESGLWKDKRHTKMPWNWQEHESGFEYAEHIVGSTNVRLTRARCKMGPLGLLPPARRRLALDGGIMPEIDQRRLNAAWPLVTSNHPDFYEYRAPYRKVRELRDAGFSIPQMAKRLKVSERTIDNRLIDVPDTLPRADVLALRAKAGGGCMRPAFWVGADYIPRGDTRTAPSALERPLARIFPPVQRAAANRPMGGFASAIKKRRNEIAPCDYEKWLYLEELMRYREQLAKILTAHLRKKEPLLSQALISDDGKFAVFQVADKYAERKLSALGREFLRNAPAVTYMDVEELLEPV